MIATVRRGQMMIKNGWAYSSMTFLYYILLFQAKQIWVCLAEKPAYQADRDACFRWFSKLMTDESDLDPNIIIHFFRNHIMTLRPSLLSHSGIKCFERYILNKTIRYSILIPTVLLHRILRCLF